MVKYKIKWTASAIARLKNIYQYYSDSAGVSVARKIHNNIIDCTGVLKTHPLAGQEEEYLAGLKQGHRYLVKGHHKILYRIVEHTIYITDIFDTRQNPKKMKKGTV